MKLSHPVRACDEAIYFKLFQKSIAIGASILRETPFTNVASEPNASKETSLWRDD